VQLSPHPVRSAGEAIIIIMVIEMVMAMKLVT
jgi:hypothetical protein